MTNSSDKDHYRSASDGPRWPLDLIRSIGSRARYFERAIELRRLLAAGSAEPEEIASEEEVCRRGWAIVQALRPADFVRSAGAGEQACDIYETSSALFGEAAAEDAAASRQLRPRGRRLQVTLMLYRFAAQPPILMIAIAPRPGGLLPES
jgi:hypothetical protein